ncbi:MAG: hypothetical protein DBX93_01330 [Oscillospiraceae bacterium]|nr:MAG: hypothetical protein DBX93_01330 [Oscillospiraceae bacterium]
MLLICIAIFAIITVLTVNAINEKKYRELEFEVLRELGFSNWCMVSYFDEYVTVKSRQTLEKYDAIKFFKEHNEKLARAQRVIERKNEVAGVLRRFLSSNAYKEHSQYGKLAQQISTVIKNAGAYRICVSYISSAGNRLGTKEIALYQRDINRFREDPSLLMGKTEYNKYLKEKQKEALQQKQHEHYDCVNKVIDFANEKKPTLFVKGSAEQLDNLIAQLFDRTVNSIKRIKTIDSEEWEVVENFIEKIDREIAEIVDKNERILAYYESGGFLKIKETCEALMSSQREFNEYITEKVNSISQLFGTRVVRNETVSEDEYQYVRPYKKTITPFTAEVSAAVFASAENSPLDYVVKNFYPNKELYPEQIQKLQLLVEELETLKEAKQIIDRYKAEYQQYIGDVPAYVMADDAAGFYTRLGFANIDESALTVEYKFSYTSGGGMAKRTFTVPMTEETIVGLIKILEGKLTISAFTREQRALMTNKLRTYVKSRDNYTCRICGNSIYAEPNLLLEIDHIVPVSKGGSTTEDNLQTLCWKCNRAKSNKVV